MEFTINLGKKSAALIILTGMVAATIPFADAATSAKPTTLCVQKSGAVVGRGTCKTGETKFTVMPGNVTRKAKTAKTLTGNAPAQPRNAGLATTFATTISSLSVLSATPRVYTSLVTVPAGTDFGTSFFNTPEMPKCPADAPLMLASMPVAVNDGKPNVRVESNANFAYYYQDLATPVTKTRWDEDLEQYVEYQDSSDWRISAETRFVDLLMDSNKSFYFELYGDEGESLPYAVKFYLSVLCVPTVDLVAAP